MQVVIESVGHRFSEGSWLFRGVHTCLTPGHIYALVGPSGSGKSTLLSLIAGWTTPTEGTITRTGDGRTAWVFQNPHGTPRRSVLDHVVFPLLAAGAQRSDAEEKAVELLKRFKLEALAHHAFHSLSGGEAQRLMLARALASHPSLFLIDEPTAQLDLHTRMDVNMTISRLADPSTIVVIATHDEATRDMCTDIIDLRAYQDGHAVISLGAEGEATHPREADGGAASCAAAPPARRRPRLPWRQR